MKEVNLLLFMAGMILSLGSIATFIVMNLTVGSSSNATLIHHQRLFVSAISKGLTIPGVCMLFTAAILSAISPGYHPFADGRGLAQLVLTALIFIITMVLVRPLVTQVTQLARQGATQGRPLESYRERKKLEDRFGAVNFALIVATLLLAVSRP